MGIDEPHQLVSRQILVKSMGFVHEKWHWGHMFSKPLDEVFCSIFQKNMLDILQHFPSPDVNFSERW